MTVPETGWYAHMEWDIEHARWKVFLTHKQYGAQRRHLAHFDNRGDVTLTEMDGSRDIQPTLSGDELSGIITALLEGAKRCGFIHDTETALTAELAGVHGELGYAKHIADRMLTRLLDTLVPSMPDQEPRP